MNELINWLNVNQGFVMSLLTCVYVLATIIIVIYTRKSIKQIEISREEESRPYIFINLHKDPRDNWFSLRIKNYGRTGGRIISISILPNLKYIDENNIEEFLKDAVLAPNQLIQCGVLNEKKDIYDNEYRVSIEYISTYNGTKVYKEEYKITTQYASQMAYVDASNSGLSPEVNQLKSIAGHLDSIRNKL